MAQGDLEINRPKERGPGEEDSIVLSPLRRRAKYTHLASEEYVFLALREAIKFSLLA